MGKEEQTNSKDNATARPPGRAASMFEVGPKFVAKTFVRAVHRNPYRAIASLWRYPVRRVASATFKDACSLVWSKMACYRPLLAREIASLTVMERIERRFLWSVLAIPDWRYRRVLKKLDAQSKTTSVSGGASWIASRRGVVMMIGTLGPGGAERQLVVTARGLHESRKSDVRVACAYLSSPISRFFLPELETAGVPASVIGAEADNIVHPAARAAIDALPLELREAALYAKTLAAEQPEVAHLWLDEVNIKGGIAAVLTGVPKIVISQRSLPPINFGLHRPYMRESYRWLARRPGVRMINNSAAGARAYEKWLGVPRGSIGVVYNGYAFDEAELAGYRADRAKFRQSVGIAPDTLVVGTVMRLSEEKCPMLWLEMASLIRRDLPEARFLIVGDGPLRAAMEARSAADDLVGAVLFAGHLKASMAAIASMDLMLLTSRAEGLPNVLVEAQFLGVPAVTTPAGGAPEAVNHGESGWVLNSWDAEASACQIVRLLRDEQWRETAGRSGPEFALARFGIRRSIDETLAVYG